MNKGFKFDDDYNSFLIDDVNYLYNIINSNLDMNQKIAKIYLFCDYCSLFNNKDVLYCTLSENDANKIDIVLKFYEKCIDKGYFNGFKNPYKCSILKLQSKVNEINRIFRIINSDKSDYYKAIQIYPMFRNAEEFKQKYTLLLEFGVDDIKLNYARLALNNFDLIYEKIKEYEEKGYFHEAKYYLRINDYIKNYEYAKFVIEYYNSSLNSYNEEEIFNELGLSKKDFEFCIRTIEELDIDLYSKYLVKKENNVKLRHNNCCFIISDLANGIRTGFLEDGTEFTLFEFIKRVPFKEKVNFFDTLMEFMKVNNPDDIDIIRSYLYSTDFNKHWSFKKLDLKAIYSVKTTINGVLLTDEDKKNIIDYLVANDIPLVTKSYNLVREKYLNGEITIEDINNAKREKESRNKVRVLIPSCK